jgi:hypothetical protein
VPWSLSQQSHSFFTDHTYDPFFANGTKPAQDSTTTQASNWSIPPQPSYPDPEANSQIFPFPGQNQRYYKTKNPFIS